ncbi:sodium/proton antiporter NhaB [Photorhabdus heterorhabditis]|uniref:Na(+)/H(+) antiporter NhaB n=1 Tax=Photorhabdus heterorhabditis TaxID=880156 RepID=A0A5B0WJ63_9GAMM|nr:sodium/proton antiporter NhaB [Photorhabdus heterorhabditis]KAA1186727.1 sodium/proton antiporter NhaB [Photorhabdus heterorhabditis]KOY61517.1 sodium:proton antiporter [Photorhabdus heterorhabditis]MBS9442546.1 sodium/proton antiporter NhaB [Photorhabdus heterorhabditis]
MKTSIRQAVTKNFLGNSPDWYKLAIISFLIINPLVFFFINPFVAGWLLVAEFIFTLAMALKCYPLQPGGLLAIEAVIIGMTSPQQISHEIANNLEVILLLIFMVAGIYFMKQLLLFAFTKLLLSIRSKRMLALAFCLASAFLSAFLDALTVIAVVISVSLGFYSIYNNFISNQHDVINDNSHINTVEKKQTLEQFRAFLRSLMMHAGLGTALGGVMTMVGEPQNLIIAKHVDWDFVTFFIRMAPVTLPVFICGLLVCFLVERFKLFGYGAELPERVRKVLEDYDEKTSAKRTRQEKTQLIAQALIGIWLVIALAFHLAEVGLIGLSVIILTTSFCGITEEHALGKAFEEALPFTALLTVFFSIVAVIVDQQLFTPFIQFVLQSSETSQLSLFYLFNGLLSAVSDNVFVGTVYINEAMAAMRDGLISHKQYEYLAVAINTGTNLPSVATPNGQAAFLFLLTSALSPLIRLSYGRMVIMALPYTIVMTLVGLLCVEFLLIPVTDMMVQWGLITLP